MDSKYVTFVQSQISEAKETMRKKIYFLLLIVDPKTKGDYQNIDVDTAFNNTLTQFNGLNSIMNYPEELVWIISTLEAALTEYHSENFRYGVYRKLVLDAGNEVLKIKEV